MCTVEHYAVSEKKRTSSGSSRIWNDVRDIQLNLKSKVYKSIVSYSSWTRI